jgi:hypothetical protein
LADESWPKSRFPPQIAAHGRAMAGLNAAMVQRGPFRSVTNWNQNIAIPAAAKVAAVLSLGLWGGVIACGRLLAYL